MKTTPCEFMMWNGLPVIRREIAESMIKDFKLNQKQVANQLCLTPAAISQYRSGKRGKIKILDEEILKEIRTSAKRIIENGGDSVISETCRICKIMREKELFSFYCNICPNETTQE